MNKFSCLVCLIEWFADLGDPCLISKRNKWATWDWESQVGKGVQTKWSTTGRIGFVARSGSDGSYASNGHAYFNLPRYLLWYLLLQVYVLSHYALSQIFSALSEKVTSSREKIHAVKENLNACKQLLRCKREELLNLWLEGIEHKQVLHLLKDV